MKTKKKLVSIIILIIASLLLTSVTGSFIPVIDNNYSDQDSEDRIVSMLVYLKDQVDINSLNSMMDQQRASLRERHESRQRAFQACCTTRAFGIGWFSTFQGFRHPHHMRPATFSCD